MHHCENSCIEVNFGIHTPRGALSCSKYLFSTTSIPLQMEPNLFVPPAGHIRNLPKNKLQEYSQKIKSLGPFRRHIYDMDICVLYRQMDDLQTSYDTFAGRPYSSYVNHFRESAEYILKSLNLDPEFYLNHFYFVLKPDSPHYVAYLGHFFALSDPLRIIPLLEYHLNEFKALPNLTPDNFLGHLEYTACNFIRTNRFPKEDYFVKHDKIINWIYSRRDFQRYESLIIGKFDQLIKVMNTVVPKKIPRELMTKKEIKKSKPIEEVKVIEEKRTVLFDDIKDFFSEDSHSTLEILFSGLAESSLTLIFNGQANQLVDVFRIYVQEKFIR